jgi:predicted deacetylase
MKVTLRDDDTSFFTSPEQLHAVYHDIWDRLPVSLAVVPKAAGYRDKAIPEKYWQADRAFPLEENAALVAFLREHLAAGHVTVAQHGYTHEEFPGGYEFQAAPDLEQRQAKGHAYLEGLLDTRIEIFVPPHNALSKRGLSVIDAAGLNLLGSFLYFRPSLRQWDAWTPGNWWRVRQYRGAMGRTKADRLIYPHVLRYANHSEFGCYSLIPGTTVEELVAGFEEARRAGGHFCIATHYWEVDAVLKDVLRRVLDHAARYPDVEFVAAERLFEPASAQ